LSTTSPTPCVRVPRYVARLVAPLVIDYFAYAVRPGASARRAAHRVAHHRLLCLAQARTPRARVPRHVARFVAPLVVDYFAYIVRTGASARRVARRVAHRRLLRLAQARTPRVRVPRHVARLVSPFVVDYFSNVARWVPWHVVRLVVDFFAYATRPGASARRAARRRLLRLRRASRCLGTSRSLSSTSSPTPCVRVPRHVTQLVVDYFAYAVRPGASARHVARHRLLCAPRLRLAATLALLFQPRRVLRLLVSRQHGLYFEYTARCCNVVFRSHHIDHSSQLVFQTSRERQSHPQQLIGINSD
jgi:hypothetical protein